MSLERHVKNPYADFSKIYNKNEKRIQTFIVDLLEKNDARFSAFSEKDLQDIYALTLNFLRPRYMHQGTIVVKEVVTKDEIIYALDDAINITRYKPKE